MSEIKQNIEKIKSDFLKLDTPLKKIRSTKSTVWIHRLREIEEKIKHEKLEENYGKK